VLADHAVLSLSTDGIMTAELADGLKELAADCCSQRKVHIVEEGTLVLPEVVNQGDVALFCSSGEGKRAVVTEPSQGQNLARSCYSFQSFGIHYFHFLDEEDEEGGQGGTVRRPPRVMCETPVYKYARSINKLFDVMYWGWDSSRWNDELESSLLELLVAANEDLRPIAAKMDALASMHMGGGELLEMVQQVSDDLQKAMADRDPQAMGRLHQACFQLVETCWLLGLPENLTRSIKRFERTKLGQSNTAVLRSAMDECASSLARYLSTCPSDPAFKVSIPSRLKSFLVSPGFSSRLRHRIRDCVNIVSCFSVSSTSSSNVSTCTSVHVRFCVFVCVCMCVHRYNRHFDALVAHAATARRLGNAREMSLPPSRTATQRPRLLLPAPP